MLPGSLRRLAIKRYGIGNLVNIILAFLQEWFLKQSQCDAIGLQHKTSNGNILALLSCTSTIKYSILQTYSPTT